MAARFPVKHGRLLRVLACACLAWPLAACETHSDLLQVGELLYQGIVGGGADEVPRSKVAAVPFATLGVRLGSSGQAMFVLESKSGEKLEWVGGTQFAIATRDGRILRTVGFVHNLSGFREDTSASPHDTIPTKRDFRYDLADMNAYNVFVHCNDQDAGPEQVTIIGETHKVRHVIEDCEAPEIAWSFRNEFWRDAATGAVWRSVQYVHPGLDPVTLETLRPAG
jgi:hypothetical protein